MSDTMHAGGTVRHSATGPHQPVPSQHVPFRTGQSAGVPREFAHRRAMEDVLIMSWSRLDDDHFSLAAQWPYDHQYFTPSHGRHHPLLAGETIRQAGLLLSHAELGVPLGHHFILADLVYTTDPERLTVGTGPAALTIDVRCSNTRMRAGAMTSSRFDMTIRRDGRIVATGNSSVTVTAPAVYRRIRGERLSARHVDRPLPAPVSPRLTGSTHPDEVLLTPTDQPDRWLLRLATGHASVVNPANDHIPGMALLDAAHQAARVITAPDNFVPYAFRTEFQRYAEHDIPCVIEARRVPSAIPHTTTVKVTGLQGGEPVFASTLTALDERP
ncbi:ScbA protein [Streptomyces piniterrae]|uniref:ScbA protein n=1 Tax=Streptomyces piniterrae TaxID=2571125 RepID=A0A4U0MTY9_9ACTN|nr:ScbA/BarX family gamma-butyrolactone biosynthesis protein [Streptomyces piniterrae]TJZ44429.1 ScbA protein [Streptomyces piniterrae]